MQFDRDVSACEYSGQRRRHQRRRPNGYAAFTNSTGGTNQPGTVFVHTFDATGTAVDRPFHLAVTC